MTSAPTRNHQASHWDTQLVQMVNEAFFDVLKPRRIRSMLRFAEDEIILPDGPFENQYFRADRMPWSRGVLDVFDSGIYNRFFALGPRQTAKTLLFFQIPLMYHLFELEQDVIIGVPAVQLAKQIWKRRISKMIMKSRYADLMPEKGPGSKGGEPQQITFANGASIVFMSKGKTHTAPVVIYTEVYEMEEASENSGEAGPFRQLEECTKAFGGAKRIYAESILIREKSLMWNEVHGGTATRIYFRCPHCKEHVEPMRVNFRGWEDAEKDKEAAGSASYTCQACGQAWKTENQHVQAAKNWKFVHDINTIEINKDRNDETEYEGVLSLLPKKHTKPPQTYTFGLTWNRMHTTIRPKKSPYSVMGEIAISELNAARSEDPDDELAVSLYTWTEPVEAVVSEDRFLTGEIIFNKISRYGLGEVPPQAPILIEAIDIGETKHWWTVMAFNRETAEGFVVEYSMIPVARDIKETALAMYEALVMHRDNEIIHGYNIADSEKIIHPKLILVDSGYGKYADVIYRFCRESGKEYIATKGFGTGIKMPNWNDMNPGKDCRPGNNWRMARQKNKRTWLLEMHTDYWKTRFHDRLFAAPNTPGSIYIYKAPPQDHAQLVRHYTSEKRKTIQSKSDVGGFKEVWTYPGSKPNHWWDCGYMCLVGADKAGVRVMPSMRRTPQQAHARSRDRSDSWVRRRGGSWLRR